MTQKVYIIENVDCANCAAKIEAKIQAMQEVSEATLTFATKQLRVTAEDPDALVAQMQAIARTVEDEAEIFSQEEAAHRSKAHHEHHEHHHHHDGDCCCGHDHHHHHDSDCCCGHDHHHHHDDEDDDDDEDGHDHHHHHGDGDDNESKEILIGAALFAGGFLPKLFFDGWWTAIPFCIAYLFLGWNVLKTAGKNLLRGRVFDENFLMGIATVGALVIGEFPEAAGVMLFYRIGEWFEDKAVARSRSQIMDAVDLRPETVNRVQGDNVEVISAGDAVPGDLLLVRPGDRVPLDGVVVSGESRLDTAPITGEPVPLSVRPGDGVTSGCVNLNGQLTVHVTKPLSESMVTRILNSVENAAASKPKMDRFITRFSRVYTPVVVILAACTALIPPLFDGRWQYWVYTALSFLVMSCPCALVLSVPLAFFTGIGAGSRKGILFKGGLSIEAMAAVKAVVMDKTGTITKGNFVVQNAVGPDELLRLSACCEQVSTHPIAQSIVSAAKAQRLTLAAPDDLAEYAGRGISGTVEGHRILCGNMKLMEQFDVAVPALPDTAAARVLVAKDGKYLGYLDIADTLKDGAADAIGRLKRQGITTAMLTGDREESAQSVARQVGIDNVYAKLLPEDKLDRLGRIRTQYGPTMFVGDGINDAPVLAGADVGAAMGSGADAAIEAADVVFMTSDVSAIPESLHIARKVRRVAWQNVIFALAVKIAVMILGLLGHASMWMAVFADSGVAMLCVLNSVRRLRKKSN